MTRLRCPRVNSRKNDKLLKPTSVRAEAIYADQLPSLEPFDRACSEQWTYLEVRVAGNHRDCVSQKGSSATFLGEGTSREEGGRGWGMRTREGFGLYVE